MDFHLDEKLAIYIDGANLAGIMKQLDWQIDFGNLRTTFSKQARLIHTYYFTALSDTGYDGVRSLAEWLSRNGYIVVSKPLKVSTNHQTGANTFKGNVDVDLSVHMMQIAPHVDHIILFSGDGDFRALIEAVQKMGRRMTVIASSKVGTSPDLIRQADQFLDLEDMRKYLDRDPKTRTKLAVEASRPKPVVEQA